MLMSAVKDRTEGRAFPGGTFSTPGHMAWGPLLGGWGLWPSSFLGNSWAESRAVTLGETPWARGCDHGR